MNYNQKTIVLVGLIFSLSIMTMQASASIASDSQPLKLKFIIDNTSSATGGDVKACARADTIAKHDAKMVHEATTINTHHVEFPVLQKLGTYASDCGALLQQQASSFSMSAVGLSKWQLLGGTCATLYAALFYKMYQAYQLMRSRDAWCNWKESIEFARLQFLPIQELTGELIFEIAKKYSLRAAVSEGQLKEAQAAGSMHSSHERLSRVYGLEFLRDVQAEIATLRLYGKVCKIVHYAPYHTRIFPFASDMQTISEKIARLEFLVDLFIGWQLQSI